MNTARKRLHIPPQVDTDWFVKRVMQSEFRSIRGLAAAFRGSDGRSIDPSALSLMFRGQRRMQLSDARQLAALLDLQLSDVLARAGLPIEDLGMRQIPLVGCVNKDREVTLYRKPKSIAGPADLPRNAVAVLNTETRWVYFTEALRAAMPGRPGNARLYLASSSDSTAYSARVLWIKPT